MNGGGWIRTHSGQKRRHFRWSISGRNRWSFGIQCALLLLSPTVLFAQTPTHEQLTGTWIGVHSEWDIDLFCPLPAYLRLDADSTYHLGMVDGSAKEVRSTWGVRGDSVRLDTIHYAPRLVQLENNLLRIGSLEPMVFRRFKTIPIDSARAIHELNGRVWQCDSLRISLFANGQVSLENMLTKQRTAHYWRLARFDTSVFLIIWGNAHNRNSGYKASWQLSQVSANQVQFIGWNGHRIAVNTGRKIRNLTPNDVCQPSDFQTCANCFMKHWYTSVFYQPDKRYSLTQLVEKQYQPVQEVDQSGLLTIRCVLNCAGEIGPLEVKGYGDDYCPRVFATQIVDQFLKICRDYVAKPDFLRTNKDSVEPPTDTVVSLTFRLKNGQLIDILP